jgi:hypothetical protein
VASLVHAAPTFLTSPSLPGRPGHEEPLFFSTITSGHGAPAVQATQSADVHEETARSLQNCQFAQGYILRLDHRCFPSNMHTDEVFINFAEMKFLFVSDQLLHNGIRLVKMVRLLFFIKFNYCPDFQMMAEGT